MSEDCSTNMEYNMQMLNPHSDCKNYKTMETTNDFYEKRNWKY